MAAKENTSKTTTKNGAKAAPKTQSKASAAKTVAKSAPKAESKASAAKISAKAAPKAESKASATKTSAKAAPKAESKASAAKTSAKAAPKAESKVSAAKTSAKAAPKAESKASAAKTSAKAAPKTEVKASAVKPSAKATGKVEQKPAEKVDKKSDSKSATKNSAVKRTSKAEEVKTKSSIKSDPEKTDSKSKNRSDKAESAVAAAVVEEKNKKKVSKDADNVAKSNRGDKKSAKEKSKDEVKESKSSSKGGSSNSSDGDITVKHMAVILAIIAGLVILTLVIGIVLGMKSCSHFSNNYKYEFSNTTLVGFSSEQIGTTDRIKPVKEIKNEGLSVYPKYGTTLKEVLGDANASRRSELIRESSYLTATGTKNAGGGDYTWMDENGMLYKGTVAEPVASLGKDGKQRQLYQHSASVGLYLGNVDDKEPGVIKEVTMRPRSYTRGYNVTGIYAPAGEVIKIEMSEEDMEATGGIVIHIGQALYNGKANNIWTAKNQMQRFPVILNTMTIDKNTAKLENGVYTAYVGSFLGGPLYIRNESVTFSATISGGVNYQHFILGYTTEEEFEENSKSSAPYFDLEVWDNGVLHSGPKSYAANYSFEDLYKVAALWEKVSLVSTSNSTQGIVFIYDPFVAAGAAVAFPGQGSVNCPAGWMRDALNYKGIVTSGSWGNFHEYHHNFQNYGVGDGGEVTNNGMTLVSYSQFTKISSARGMGNYGAESMSGWNRYTSATWSLEDVLKIAREGESPSNGNKGLSIYATLLHNFGADNYIQSKVRQQRAGYGQSYVGYLKAWQDITHNDMTYFFKDILKGLSDTEASQLSNSEYPMFVPVASVYQTGRSYIYDGEKKYFSTMQPYVIQYGKEFTVDLREYKTSGDMYESGSVKIPEGFSFKVKNVTNPKYGKLTDNGDGTFTYTPDKKQLNSGQIIVTLEITKDNGAFKVDDVDLVLELEQSHEMNKNILERTTYKYSADKMYTDAVEAYNNSYANYTSKEEGDSRNGTQNSNTDIWYYPTDYKDQSSPYIVPDNSVAEVRGKLYVKEAGKYRIYLRGRANCALYYSTEGDVKDKYKLGATIKDYPKSGSQYFRPNDSKTWFDLDITQDESWIYFKSVLIVKASPVVSYIGLGMAQWTDPMFTIVDDEKGVKHYYDYQGNEVSEAEANSAEQIPPIITDKNQPYVNAYRSSYEFPKGEFEADYMYKSKYNYNYTGEKSMVSEGKTQTSTSECNYRPWKGLEAQNALNHLFDGDPDTGIHFAKEWGVSESNPAILAFDLGESITANSMILYTNNKTGGNDKGFPKDFKLEGSLDGVEYFEMGSWTNQSQPAVSREYTFNDNKSFTFKYYKLTVTRSGGNGRCSIAELQFANTLRLVGNGDNFFSPDNDMFVFDKKWKAEQAHSSFGHVYLGKSGAKMKFEFEGTRFIIFSSMDFGHNFEVKIDGKAVSSVELSGVTGKYGVTYISQKLSSGNHKVEIKCKGKANIDSIAIYDEDKPKAS